MMARRFAIAAIGSALTLGLVGSASAEINYTNALGGAGGSPFEVSCNSGDFLIGINYTAGKALNVVAPMCTPIRNAVWTGKIYEKRERGSWNFNGHFGVSGPAQCPVNQYITALHVWWDKFGIVHHVEIFCHDVTRQSKQTIFTASAGGEPSHDGSAPCPRGSFAIGLIGGYGALIDRIGLKCQTLAP